ncbi:MAG: aspartate/glutamate racemase family protein [Phycisphaerales bacterium]|nr:aspartate/glutamate racemase family protein [Phycisphaerales bacterium]
MKTIGMLGGMSWESTAEYYRLANELVRERLGGYHSAAIVLASVDFAEIERLQVAGRWDEAGDALADLKEKRAVDTMRRMLETSTSERGRRRAQRWIDSIEGTKKDA